MNQLLGAAIALSLAAAATGHAATPPPPAAPPSPTPPASLAPAGASARVQHAGGEWLLHWNSRRDGNYEVYRQEADGRETNQSNRASNEWLWSAHDGGLLGLSNERRDDEAKGWRPVRFDGKDMHRISQDTSSDGFVDCHPSGEPCLVDSRIERKRHVAVLDKQGQRQRWLDDGSYETSDPQYSPDGKQLLFRATRSGTWELWLGDADGSQARQLTRDPANDTLPSHEYGGEGPARFSPDGKRIVWMRMFPGGKYDVWTMQADGSSARNLTADNAGSDAYPSFSPDGAQIAFDSDRDGDSEIYLMAADGGNVRRVTYSKGIDLAPLWVRTP
jgi:WD40 repeat protein